MEVPPSLRFFVMEICIPLSSCEQLVTVLKGNAFLASYQVLYHIEDMISRPKV